MESDAYPNQHGDGLRNGNLIKVSSEGRSIIIKLLGLGIRDPETDNITVLTGFKVIIHIYMATTAPCKINLLL